MTCAAAFAQQPRIDSLSPSQGPIAGGTIVTISGANFSGATVKFDRAPVTPLSQSDSAIRLLMPQHDNGYARIQIGNAATEFLYLPPKLQDLPPGFITTVAGIGQYARDFGPATQASIGENGLAFDSAGNLYIADTGAYIIYRVRTDGTIERFAGGGAGPDVGDGGPATNAFFIFPRDIAIDRNDNVYIPDAGCRIRRVDRSGVITTIAGTGVCGFTGDGGTATAAQIGRPTFLTADGDDLFFIDWSAMRVRRVHLADGTISTFAGTGVAGFSGDGGLATQASFNIPLDDFGGLALDPGGNVYLIDSGNDRIRRIDRSTGIITTFYASAAGARSIACDPQGNVYLGAVSPGIIEVDRNGQFVGSWGNGTYALPVDGVPAATAGLGHVVGLAIDAGGNIVYSDDAIGRVRRINVTTGLLDTVAGIGPKIIGEDGPAIATTVSTSPEATDIAIAPTGELLIADSGQFRVRRLERNGNLVTIAGTGAQVGLLQSGVPAKDASIYPVGIKVTDSGAIEITQRTDVVRIDANGLLYHLGGRDIQCGYEGDGGPFNQARLCQPWDIALDRGGNLYIADTNNNRIRRVDAKTNVITTVVGNGGPVSGFEHYGQGQSYGDGGPAVDACINTPYGIAFDDRSNLYISEQTGIRKVDPSGTISTFATLRAPSPLGGITKLAFFHGYVYFAVQRVGANGVITQIAGGGIPGPMIGDGGPALSARINTGGQGSGVAIDAEGNLYFVDLANHRVRAVRYGAVLAPPGGTIQATVSGSTVTARVLDAANHVAPSVRVDFAAPTSGASCILSSPFAITDANGVASVSCTPNCIEGTYSVTATPLTAASTATVSFTNSGGPCHHRAARH